MKVLNWLKKKHRRCKQPNSNNNINHPSSQKSASLKAPQNHKSTLSYLKHQPIGSHREAEIPCACLFLGSVSNKKSSKKPDNFALI